MTKLSPKITRRNFLKLLAGAGAGVVTAELLHIINSARPSNSSTTHPEYKDQIKNIVFFLQENHTFDSLFANFPGANGKLAELSCTDSLRRDPPHKHIDALQPNGATTVEANCSYSEYDAPNYWKLAHAFTLCDNFFSGVRGPSHPNYLMMIAGQSPIIDAPKPSDVCPEFCLDIDVLPNRLDEAELSWRDYGGIFTSIKSLVGRPEVMDFRDEQFFIDAENGNLPNVAWLNSGFLEESYPKSGHPPPAFAWARTMQ